PRARIPARACNFDREAKGLAPNRSFRSAPWLDGITSSQGANMRKQAMSVLALAIATGLAHAEEPQSETAGPEAHHYLAPAALIAAGVAAAAVLAGRGGGHGGNTAGGSASSAGTPAPRA